MQNQLLGSILNNIVMEKAVRDKIVIQQKEQREQQARKKMREEDDDEFDDEETRKIMAKMRNQVMEKISSDQPVKEFKRTIGQYREIVETEFLDYVTKNRLVVVHFYHKDFQRCKVMDKHLRAICMLHPETHFLYINAEKAPFFIEKLHVRSLPTLCLFIDGKMKDKVIGFEGMSGDDFRTPELTARLIKAGVIERKEGEGFKIVKGGKGRRQGNDDSGSDIQ